MIFSKIRSFTNSIKSEWRHLRWPSKAVVLSSLKLVIIFSTVCSIIFFGIDFIFSNIIGWVLNNA
ncbi:preprotein translocase subunit SecE [Candidatus Cytomitobacter indipagum]|uniref:Protein translocase subunit SecE n=1 Tax=Candidatus Cytomitobacter indipagum TaxID=2601575 RepID=A0A5C0UDY8_9PROT|nr:preprotein translocase subunit SecE [Candidatus Cytomitobacter indipagum]